MSKVVFSSWGRQVVDNRQGDQLCSLELSKKLPVAFDGEREIAAFMGWDGLILKDESVDVVLMAAEYAKRIQEEYCCGKCSPGKKGTRVMQDTLARIVAGQGSEQDLQTIETLGNCCRTANAPSVRPRSFRSSTASSISVTTTWPISTAVPLQAVTSNINRR